MSAEKVGEVVLTAAHNSTFRDDLLTNPDSALATYGLSAEEQAAIKALSARRVEDEAPRPRSPIAPSSFKEIGALVLSALVVVVFVIVLVMTVAQVNDDPRAVQIGNAVQTVDSWSRAKDLLATIFPLLGAVVTFWLGVAVEGRRAEDNKASAERAVRAQQRAEVHATKTSAVARDAIRGAKSAIKGAAPRTQFETRSGTAASSFDAVLDILDEAEQRLI